eukprot:scaffold345229_cov28-Attheya_sp.AAC.1
MSRNWHSFRVSQKQNNNLKKQRRTRSKNAVLYQRLYTAGTRGISTGLSVKQVLRRKMDVGGHPYNNLKLQQQRR